MCVAPPAIAIFGLIGGISATGAYVEPSQLERQVRSNEGMTSSGVSVSAVSACGADLAEVRRLSGLTWEQLSRLFGVSQRALHFWASGRPMKASHEEHLQRTLGALRAIDRGTASANRVLLLTVTPSGESAFDMLADGRYEDVRLLCAKETVTRGRPRPLGKEARGVRRPLPLEVLADARQDAPATPAGRVLGSSPIRRVRKG